MIKLINLLWRYFMSRSKLNCSYFYYSNSELHELKYHDLSYRECLDIVLEATRDPEFKEVKFY